MRLLVALIPLLVAAQTNVGGLRIQVTDPSGSVVPAASVKVTKTPSIAKSAKTDVQGTAIFSGLEPGLYTVEAASKGFATYQLQNLEIVAGRTQTIRIPLVLATTVDQVTVSDSAKVDVDPSNNAGALVLRKPELEALSDDRTDLAIDLQALAGPAAARTADRSLWMGLPEDGCLRSNRSAKFVSIRIRLRRNSISRDRVASRSSRSPVPMSITASWCSNSATRRSIPATPSWIPSLRISGGNGRENSAVRWPRRHRLLRF